ncbi:MAG TPA: 50S ribosomal protein L35 [Syntrophomonadaceae bacterium]|nr:50S ribosomal protein L35 [Syntrophomonadaceae bacterium]
MPKLKSHRGAAKRFKKTGSGKIKRSKAYASHLLGGKSPKRKRGLRKACLVSEAENKNIARLIPY